MSTSRSSDACAEVIIVVNIVDPPVTGLHNLTSTVELSVAQILVPTRMLSILPTRTNEQMIGLLPRIQEHKYCDSLDPRKEFSTLSYKELRPPEPGDEGWPRMQVTHSRPCLYPVKPSSNQLVCCHSRALDNKQTTHCGAGIEIQRNALPHAAGEPVLQQPRVSEAAHGAAAPPGRLRGALRECSASIVQAVPVTGDCPSRGVKQFHQNHYCAATELLSSAHPSLDLRLNCSGGCDPDLTYSRLSGHQQANHGCKSCPDPDSVLDQVLHCVMFPRLDFDLPVLGMDMVGAKGRVSLAVIDPSPVAMDRTLPPLYSQGIK